MTCSIGKKTCIFGKTLAQRYNFLLFDGFSNHCLANMVEPFRAANTLTGQELYAWRFYSLDGQPVHSSSGLPVSPQSALGEEVGDVLVIMPSYGFRNFGTRTTSRSLRLAASRHVKVAGLDTGSWLMASAGLLDDRRATIHWDELPQFEEAFPTVDAVKERFVIDGNRLTCSGALASFDLASAIILEDHGALLSMEIAHLLMHPGTMPSHLRPLRSRDTLVNRVLDLMQSRLEDPMLISDIAKELGCSQKKIETHVRSELRITPQALYRRLRLNLVRKLAIETDQSIAEISGRCGYENASAMTRAFKAEYGQTPSACRKSGQFGLLGTKRSNRRTKSVGKRPSEGGCTGKTAL